MNCLITESKDGTWIDIACWYSFDNNRYKSFQVERKANKKNKPI